MHDTSTESMSKWRAVGTKRSDSMILSTGTVSSARIQSRQYRPSKQREISNSKIFNRNRSRIQSSFDNMNKDDLNDSRSKMNDSRSKEVLKLREKKETAIQEPKKHPVVRVNSIIIPNENKEEVTAARTTRAQKTNNFFVERELITLKNDYTKFKQKILTELEIQKHNITKLVNQILESVKLQLLAIQDKYAKSSTSLKREQSMPLFSNFNAIMSPMNIKQHDISMIKNISPAPMSRNPTQKLLIAELTSKQSLQDPITQRFSNFYLAIEKMKSQLNDLHEISTNNQSQTPSSSNSPLISNSIGLSNGVSRYLKT